MLCVLGNVAEAVLTSNVVLSPRVHKEARAATETTWSNCCNHIVTPTK